MARYQLRNDNNNNICIGILYKYELGYAIHWFSAYDWQFLAILVFNMLDYSLTIDIVVCSSCV